ncbi:MAG: sigma-70 family RNA polymerase sigma factor [Lachnospiraceae bacterium]|nr:sigma-70 family RNA polymerase sigma factor [Lachnospiraceae bacterium]
MSLDYSTMNDNQILELIKLHDTDAMEFLLKKHSPIVKKEIRTMYIIGAETEDLYQEGMIGLFKAIRDYEPSKGAVFSTFATLCVKNQVKSAVTAANRKKHSPLNQYISIYAGSDEDGDNEELFMDDGEKTNPEKRILAKENENELLNSIKERLSKLEVNVLNLYLDGLSYAEIGEQIDKSEKSINNALQRIRAKLSK